jgi:hypothetical protein
MAVNAQNGTSVWDTPTGWTRIDEGSSIGLNQPYSTVLFEKIIEAVDLPSEPTTYAPNIQGTTIRALQVVVAAWENLDAVPLGAHGYSNDTDTLSTTIPTPDITSTDADSLIQRTFVGSSTASLISGDYIEAQSPALQARKRGEAAAAVGARPIAIFDEEQPTVGPTGVENANQELAYVHAGYTTEIIGLSGATPERLIPTGVAESSHAVDVANLQEDPSAGAEGTPDGLIPPDPSGSTGLTNGPEIANSPSAAVTGFTATTLTNEANIYDGSDTTFATHAPGTNNVDYGRYFPFAAADWSDLPANAIVTGIALRARLRATTNNRLSVFFQWGTANGSLVGSEGQADGGTPLGTTVSNYGANTVPAMNFVPTRAQLVTGTFGVRLRWRRTNTVTLEIYTIEATVTYSLPGSTVNSFVRVTFPTPAAVPATGAGKQKFRARLAPRGTKDGGVSANPQGLIRLFESGTNKSVASTAVDITADQMIELAWDASSLTTPDGSGVEARVEGAGVSGQTASILSVDWLSEPTLLAPIDRTATDPLGTLDSAQAVRTLGRSRTDPLGLLDSAQVMRNLIRQATDALGILDSAQAARTIRREATDGIGVLDSTSPVLAEQIEAQVQDQIGALDSASAVKILQRSQTDSLEGSDSASRAMGYSRSQTDPLGGGDSVEASRQMSREEIDPLGMDDDATANLIQFVNREATDPLGAQDSSQVSRGLGRSEIDPLGILDSSSARLDHRRSEQDFLDAFDSEEVERDHRREEIDPLGLSDQTQVQIFLLVSRSATDQIGLTDSRLLEKDMVREISEALGISDQAQRTASFIRQAQDGIGAQDSAQGDLARVWSRAATDALGLDDLADALEVQEIFVAASSSLGITDSSVLQKAMIRGAMDSLTLDDSIHMERQIVRAVAEALGISDQASRAMLGLIEVEAQDDLGLSDWVAAVWWEYGPPRPVQSPGGRRDPGGGSYQGDSGITILGPKSNQGARPFREGDQWRT